MQPTPNQRPRSAYIHVPFCRHHCGYCNFTVAAGRDNRIDDYLTAIEREISSLAEPHEVDTLFLGGGTPTHLSEPQLARLLSAARRWLPLARAAEMTIEANPIDLSAEKVSFLADEGVTRVSLGVQSFDDEKLRVLERDHRRETILLAVELSRARFPSVAIDMIFGSPGETLEGWHADLEMLMAVRPDHVSTYGLTFERGTTFWGRLRRDELQQVAEEVERAMYLSAIDRLAAAGYEHYEVSNFARPGHRSRHNQVYWRGEPYLAFGPGAARYVAGRREMNHRSVTTYLRRVLAGQSPVAESERLEPRDLAIERLVFALRMLEGVDPAEFASNTGYTVEELVGPMLKQVASQGLMAVQPARIRLTREGLLISDAIWGRFLSASNGR